MPVVNRGELVELELDKLGDDGTSIARVDGVPVHVEDAVPGDRVKAYIYNTESNRAEAKLDTLLDPSDLRVNPRCRYTDACGGCKWQHVDYEAQLDAKRRHVVEALEERCRGASDTPVPKAVLLPQQDGL